MTIGFLVTSLTKTLLPKLISLARWPALGLVVPIFLYLKMEATVFFETFNAAGIFFIAFPRSVPRHNRVSEFSGQSLQPPGMVFALTCTVNCEIL